MPQMEAQNVRKSRRLLNKRSSEVVPSCIPEGLFSIFTKKAQPIYEPIKPAEEKLAPIFRKKPPSKEVAPLASIFLKPKQRRAPKAAKTRQNEVIEISESESSPELLQPSKQSESIPVIEISDDNLSPETFPARKPPAQEGRLEKEVLTYPKSKMLELAPLTRTCHIFQSLSEQVPMPITPINFSSSTLPASPRLIWNSYEGILDDISPKDFSILQLPSACQSHQKGDEKMELSQEPKGIKRKAKSQSSPKKKPKFSHTSSDNEKPLMYTTKYKPFDSSEGVWKRSQVAEFRNWLEGWSLNNKDHFEEEEEKVRCLLLEGATGSGKTTLVYTLAAELGYKVIEVNASSSRSGAEIRSKLKEVTQSHHMEYKPSTATSSSSSSLCQQVKKPKDCTANPIKKKTIITSQRNNEGSPSNSIHNFFNKESTHQSKLKKTPKPKTPKKKLPSMENSHSLPEANVSISSRTLILFEDVDIVFEQDEGFWRAVNEFIHNSKKPVVLTFTSSLPFILSNLKENFKHISLEYPTLKSTLDNLSSVVAKEHIDLNAGLLKLLLENSGGDLRRSLLQLQFWSFGKSLLTDETDKPEAHSASMSPNFNVGKLLSFDLEVASIAMDNIQSQYWFGHNILFTNFAYLLPGTSASLPSVKDLTSENSVKINSSIEIDFSWAIQDQKDVTENSSSVTAAEVTKTPKHIMPVLENILQLADALSDSDMFSKLSSPGVSSTYKKLQHFQESFPKEHLDSTTRQPEDLPCNLSLLAAKKVQGHIVDACNAHPDLRSYMFPQHDFKLLPFNEGPGAFKSRALAKQVRHSGFFRHLSSSAVHLDFTPYLRKIMVAENHKIATKRSKRHLHYLDSINIDSSMFRNLL